MKLYDPRSSTIRAPRVGKIVGLKMPKLTSRVKNSPLKIRATKVSRVGTSRKKGPVL